MDPTQDKAGHVAEHIEQKSQDSMHERSQIASRQAGYEKTLGFFETVRIFWRSTLWILYGQLVVFGYGIDGIIAGNLLAIPKFR